jgi:hypothetical protein
MTMFYPADVSTITEALRVRLSEGLQAAYGKPVFVERSEPVNENPDRCPWVGVYRARQSFPAKTIGMGTGFRDQRATLVIVANESSSKDGATCEDRLEGLMREVFAIILNDTSISGTVIQIEDIDVTWSNYTTSGNAFFQEATVLLTTVVPVTAQ